jgi:predicted O-methyltransferase YrrM
VLDPDADDEDTRALRALNAKLAEDERVTLCLLPLADGVTLARRRDTGPAPTGSGAA